jgi:hypothetical protein
MKTWQIFGLLVLLCVSVAYGQYCYSPSYSTASYPSRSYTVSGTASYQVFREVTDFSAGYPEVPGYRPVGLIAPTDGTVRLRDRTGVEVDVPVQSGIVSRVTGQDLMAGGTLASVLVVYR